MQERIKWEAFEFDYKEKTSDWFWAVAIISIAIAVIAFIYNNILFAIFILLAGAMFAHHGKREPMRLDIELNTKGLILNQILYPYQNIKTFWVEENKWSPPKLILRIDRMIDPIMVLPIETDEVNAEDIRNHLLNFIVEEKIPEPISQKLMEYLGF